jgi:prepilin-type N-terminal cleavage/methylation domain-containing protein
LITDSTNRLTDRQTAANRGFTIYEVVIVMTLMGLALAGLGPIFSSNDALAKDTHAHQQAEATHRKNMVALARVLRGVDIQSLAGFGSDGVATTPEFGRVTGADLDDLTYSGDEKLIWMPSPLGVDGVTRPGAVYLMRDGKRFLVADRVPADSFFVRQEGQNLVIHLTTYYATSARRLVMKTSESVVSVRN